MRETKNRTSRIFAGLLDVLIVLLLIEGMCSISSELSLDTVYDRGNINVPTGLSLGLFSDTPSRQQLDDILHALKATLDAAGLRVDYYTVFLYPPEGSIDAMTFEEISAATVSVEDLPAGEIL